MNKNNRLEWKLLNEIERFLHANMFSSLEDCSKLTYELCYLWLLNDEIFKKLSLCNKIITLEEFINEYFNFFNAYEKQFYMYQEKKELNFENADEALTLAKQVLEDIERYKYSLKDIKPLLEILHYYDKIVIRNIMLIDLYEGSKKIFNTPEQICKLSNYILNISKNDNVLDICSGYGNYLINVTNCNEYGNLTGIEINKELSLISKIRLISLASNFTIINSDALSEDLPQKYDKIFCNYPFGFRYEKYELDFVREKNSKMRFNWDHMSGSSNDWLFVNLTLSSLKENGKAIVLMPPGPLFKIIDEQYRKDIVEKEYLESIIKIPILTKYTSIQQYMLVLGENKTNKVKFIDLSQQVEKINKYNVNLNMSSVFEILNDNNNTFIKEIDKTELEKNGYILTVENYVGKEDVRYLNPKKLSEYVEDVFRGYQISSKEQKELADANGEYELLLISDINDGSLSDELIRINSEKGKFDRYLVKENDLIISSKGTRIKIAIAEDIADRKIIATGNLIVLRVDNKRINPLFLEMYLNSRDGQTILNQIQTGAVIISINPSKLVEITISTLPMDKQNLIANKYKAKKQQIKIAKEHLLKLEQEKTNFFETNLEGTLD